MSRGNSSVIILYQSTALPSFGAFMDAEGGKTGNEPCFGHCV